jgi:TRAP-type C4-dicarboxylate transport system permease small subunit
MLALLERTLRGFDWILSRLAATTILAVMLMIVVDVFGRYALSRPLPWVYDLVSIYVVNLVLFFMASEVLRTRSNIELDLHVRLLPRPAWQALQMLAWILVAVVVGVTDWRIVLSTLDSLSTGEVHPGLYEWPVWLEKAIVVLGLGVLGCRILVRLARFVAGGFDANAFNIDESASGSRTD